MRAIWVGILLAGLFTGSLASWAKDRKVAELPEGRARVELPVKGMTCGGCVAAVKIAVKKLDGIVEVDGNHKKGTATIVYERDKTTVSEIVKAINKTGFKASPPERRPAS